MPRSHDRASFPPETERPDRRTEILAKATQMFARFGFKKTTLEEIGQACGLGKAALYHYFGSKEEIFAAVIVTKGERILQQLRQAAAAETDPEHQLMAVLRLRLRLPREWLAESGVSYETVAEMLPMVEAARSDLVQAETALIVDILETGQRKGIFQLRSPEHVARALHLGVRSFDPYVISSDASVIEGTDELFEIVVRGLRAKPPRSRAKGPV